MKKIKLLLLFFLETPNLCCEQTKMIVTVPVSDLRSKTVKVNPNLKPPVVSKDMNGQNSQLLFNECILAEEVKGNPEWLKIQAIEQEIIDREKETFVPCPGFIEKKSATKVEEFPEFNLVVKNLWVTVFEKQDTKSKKILPVCIGTQFEGEKISDNWWKVKLPENKNGYIQNTDIYEIQKLAEETEDELRQKLIISALLFLDCPYVFGGRSPYNEKLENQITGIDCSDFTNLVYRSCGIQIPKNSNSQWKKAKETKTGSDMKPGDFIFFFDDSLLRTIVGKKRVIHVMIYIGQNKQGQDLLIEATGMKNTTQNVRVMLVKDYLGKNIKDIKPGEDRSATRNLLIYFGSFFNSPETRQN